MKRILLSLLLPIVSFASSDLAIYKSPTHMSFSSDEFSAVVPNYMVSKSVREMKPERLAAILNSGNAYLTFNECSDGNYAVDMQGRVRGAGLTGGMFGYCVVKVIVPIAVIAPSAAALYATKAVIHLRAGPQAGDAFQKGVIDNALPKISNAAFNASDALAPWVGAAVGIATGPA